MVGARGAREAPDTPRPGDDRVLRSADRQKAHVWAKVLTVSTIVNVAVFNIKNGGWNPKTRFHDHTKLTDALAQLPAVPHLLFLPECSYFRMFAESPLWEATNRLNKLLPDGDFYYPFISQRHGHRNHPGLFVSARTVEPVAWHLPGPDSRAVLDNFLECRVAGHPAWLHCVHWDGSGGPAWFDIQSARAGQMGAKPSLMAGDFNCGSAAEKLPTAREWAERNKRTPWKLRQKARRKNGLWTPQSEPYDDFLESGFWDAAQIAKDTTPTVNSGVDFGSEMLIDRAAGSHKLPARLVDGSYQVFIPEPGTEVSDHRMVYFELEFAARYAGYYALAA